MDGYPNNFGFRFRNGSVIADFVLHFNETRNTTVLQTARTVLNESLYNGSTFEGLEFDPTRSFLQGMKASPL